MANRNQLMSIPLNGQLCLNKTKVDIEQFNGFNKINAPIYGGCLSPLYKKEVTPKGDYWDTDGNYYQAKADGLYKNGELVMEYTASDVTVEIIEEGVNEKILAIRGSRKIVLLKNVKYPGTQNPTVRFYENETEYYDVEYNEIEMLDFYIDRSGKMFYLVERTQYLYLYYVQYLNNEFTLSHTSIYIEVSVLESPFIKAYCYGDSSYSLVTVYAKSLESHDYGNTLASTDPSTTKLYYNVIVFNTNDESLRFKRNPTLTVYAESVTNIAVNPSCFVEEGIICLYPNTVSGDTKTFLGINTAASASASQNKVECFARSNYEIVDLGVNSKINDVTFTVNKNFFRILYSYKDGFNKVVQIIVDPRQTYGSQWKQQLNYFFMACGLTSNTKKENISPSSYPLGNMEVLINNNLPSNVSYKNKIYCDWFTIDSDFYITFDTNSLYFRDTKGTLYKYTVSSVTPKITEIIDDRFIITNTTDNYCYDIKTCDTKTPFSDYNGRLVRIHYFRETTACKDVILGASINPKYELTNDSVCSAIFPAIIYYGIDMNHFSFPKGVDVFYSVITENTVAKYQYTGTGLIDSSIVYQSRIPPVKYKEVLDDSTYPVSTNGSMQLNMNANSKYVQTYNNHDFVINGSTSYALNYYNGEVVLLYSMLSAIENLQNVFVLNTSAYGISKDKIFAMYYSDGVSTLGEVVANIKGLQYVGALPTRAIFYNPLDRCLYCFTGDAILSKYIECSDVSAVYNSWYNASSQTILFSSNAGLYVMSNDFIYNLDFRPENIFFLDGGKFVMNLNNDSEKSIFFAYEKLDSGYTTLNIQLETKYYGEGRNLPGVVDCWYIRFFNNGIKEGGTIKVRASALTDTGKVGEEKEIALLPSSWDKETDSYYLRFQPHLQKGIGVCLELDSPFAILDITCGYSGFDGAAQISHNNL